MADRNLAAIGEAGFLRRQGLAFDHRDFVAVRREVPGAGHADHAGAEHGHAHRPPRKLFMPNLIPLTMAAIIVSARRHP